VTKHLIAALVIIACCFLAEAQQIDPSKVEIKATKIAGNVYMLEGAGGNIGVSVGPDGILIVDDQFAPLADKIKDALKKLGEGKLKFVLNTHWHGDHTGGNAVMGREAPIVAHTNVRKRMSTEQKSEFFKSTTPASPKEALPVVTFDEALSVHFNGEEIKVLHFPQGHTDGDSVIYFTTSNVVHLGDDFFAGSFPFVDLESGGSVQGLINNVGDIMSKLPAGVRLIPGHGPISTVTELKQYHEMLTQTSDIIRKKMRARKTLDQIKKEGLPEQWKPWGTGFINTDTWIAIVYNSYSTNKRAHSKSIPRHPHGHITQ
jgi:glyoxylase-like metal-dependent hydrolase (beta-lactamase superfamily II)